MQNSFYGKIRCWERLRKCTDEEFGLAHFINPGEVTIRSRNQYSWDLKINRNALSGLVITLVLSLIPNPAYSIAKIVPDGVCKIDGQEVSFQRKIYACLRSGKKIFWNEQAKVVVPAPSPTFVEPIAPTSFIDLADRAGGISYWGWKKSPPN